MIRFRVVLLTMFACSSAAFAAASTDALRFTASPGVVQMRVEVLWPSGATLFSSDWKNGNVLDWSAATLPYGSYAVRIFTRDLEGNAREKQTTLHVAADRISMDGAESDLKLTTTLHDGESGQLVTTSGDLSFRFGDFLNRKDTEVMRLTAQGDLDVAGLIRTGKGIAFPDGTVQRSATTPSIMRQAGALHPIANISGAGTTNQVTKWLDGSAGMVGDSAISEVGGKVGIGTTNPGGNLHIYGSATADVFAGMGPDVISGPGFNYGYAGNSFGVGAGFFNVRPAVGATGVNPSLRFMTVDQQRMIITNTGNVGIGISNPAANLDVTGVQPVPVASGPGTNAQTVVRVIGPKGGSTGGQNSVGGTGAAVLIQGGQGGDASFALCDICMGGNGGSITLQPGSGGTGGGGNGVGGNVVIAASDAYVNGPGTGVILRSPNGTVCRRVSIDNAGSLLLVAVTCPP